VGIRELRRKYASDLYSGDSIALAACIDLEGEMSDMLFSASAFVTCWTVMSFELV
jgi:hypothetical protein